MLNPLPLMPQGQRWCREGLCPYRPTGGVSDRTSRASNDDAMRLTSLEVRHLDRRSDSTTAPVYVQSQKGRGMFVSTVSAAGLLSIPGAAPYAVTKHAAFAYAEWLFMTYADAGVRVHAVCPQGVRTQMLEDSGPAGKALMQESAIDADDVAAALLAAIETEQFLVLPHPEVGAMYAGRAADPDRWLRGMRRQARSLPS